jgi:hypothetical protein
MIPDMIHVEEIAHLLIDQVRTPDALRRMTERFDEIAAKGSTRLQQTVAASLAAELRVEGNRMRATAWRH